MNRARCVRVVLGTVELLVAPPLIHAARLILLVFLSYTRSQTEIILNVISPSIVV